MKTFILPGFSFPAIILLIFFYDFPFYSFTRTDTHTFTHTHSPDFFFFLSPSNEQVFLFFFFLFKLAEKKTFRDFFFAFDYYMIHSQEKVEKCFITWKSLSFSRKFISELFFFHIKVLPIVHRTAPP